MGLDLLRTITFELRESNTTDEVLQFLAVAAYLKYNDADVFADLMRVNQEEFATLANKVFADEKFELVRSELLPDLDSTVKKIQDASYVTILKTLTESTPQAIIDAAYNVKFEVGRERVTATPDSINQLIVALADIQAGSTVLDPTMGIGNTLVETIKNQPAKIVGQEINPTAAAMAYINLAINGANNPQVYLGDSLIDPKYLANNMKYDRVVQEPLFGLRMGLEASNLLNNDPYKRFRFGTISRSSGDWAFVSNAVSSLNDSGKAILVLPNGTLFRNGPDRAIRKTMIDFDYIETIVSLPERMFTTMSIPTSIIVLNLNKQPEAKNKIQFIKVSEDQVTLLNRRERVLSPELIEKIVAAYQSKEMIEEFAINVDNADIKNADLSVAAYIVASKYQIDGQGITVDFKKLDAMNTKPLGSIADIGRGLNVLRDGENEAGKYKVIKISDIKDDGIDYDNLTRINGDGIRIENYLVEEGDLLLSIRGTTNKIGYVDQNGDNLTFNANMVRIRTKRKYDPEWLKLYLESPIGRVLLERISKGTMIRQLSIVDIKDIPVPDIDLKLQLQQVEDYHAEMDAIEAELATLKAREEATKNSFYTGIGVSDIFEVE